jgi:hypothetical protein
MYACSFSFSAGAGDPGGNEPAARAETFKGVTIDGNVAPIFIIYLDC